MFDTGLTAYWIDPAAPNGPSGLGVTAWSVEDACAIVRRMGYGKWIAADARQMQITSDVSVEMLDPYVRRHMGPLVVRGLWYPFTVLGIPPGVDA